ncbi:MAG: B12-binding domain-containing radical SAM protein [Acidobacteria bacterium]|nr:B12-binding domain-containing radical SAM protein [Acidobacteriota bacterium]
MKVLLVYPEFPDTYWSFRYALSFEKKRSAFPPLGLLTISSLLPDSWQRRLVDVNVEALNIADIKWADIVFLSAMLVQKESLQEIVELCKILGKRVVVGGPYITTNTDALPLADHFVLGEAENVLSELIADLEQGKAKRFYKASERPSLTISPIPDFKLVKLQHYSAMSIQYSRGCPFQCEFCDIIEIYGRVPRTKTNEQVLAELDVLLKIGWQGSVFIVDDNFIGNKRNVKLMLPKLIEWQKLHNYPFTLITEASVNLAEDDKLLEAMQQAGFHHVFLGIETPVEASLKEAQKPQNLRASLLDSIKKIQSYGMEVMAGFIVGFDNDPEDIFERQIEFIQDSAIPLAMVGLLNALPETQLWRRLQREGRLLMESTGDNTNCSLNFIPKMDPTKLIEGYKTIMRTIYTSKEYYKRVLECLKRLPQDKVTTSSSESKFADNLIALVRVIVKLGLQDRDRKNFWNYLYSVFLYHRNQFSQAIRLAAMGYHFRSLTDIYFK